MKKARGKGASAKSRARPKSVDEYLAAVPEPARSTLNKVRAAIQSAVPAETTEVISYGIPAFRYKRVVMWYAAFSDHCSLFPTSSVIAKFKEELKSYRISKGTVQFPADKSISATLIKKMVKARLVEIESKK
jgi:uncharacterized protein YdhG (YjbR/CyaY superfamily)